MINLPQKYKYRGQTRYLVTPLKKAKKISLKSKEASKLL